MNFDFSEEQRMLRDLCGKIASDFDDDYWQGIDDDYRFPMEYWNALRDQGLLGLGLPEEFGGSGMGMLEMCIAAEALASCPEGGGEGGAMFVCGPVFGGYLIAGAGTQQQKEKYLPAIVNGDIWAGAFTEPGAGSNITQITTEATDCGDHYKIKGQKVFISNVANAQHMAIMCRTSPYDAAKRTSGVSLMVADLPSDKIEARPFKKMGARFMDTNQVFIDNLEVPKENLVGEEGQSVYHMMKNLDIERLTIAGISLGIAQACTDQCIKYANERKQFGKNIGEFQLIQKMIAEMATETEMMRNFLYNLCYRYDQGERGPVTAAMAKLQIPKMATKIALDAIQLHGGYGYSREFPVERLMRDNKLNEIGAGTNEVMIMIIAKNLLKEASH
jgi:alkylation response protein AidB-like acyl-CoA dehydrogenase